MQARIFRAEGHGAVFQHKAGDARRTDALGFVECGRVVAELEESLEVLHVLSDVDDFVSVVAFHLCFHVGTVGTGVHSINLDHDGIVF